MIQHKNYKLSRRPTTSGRGLLNTLINKLPFELHLPGYQFCGPGTKLEKRLARGDVGVNLLDRACREHDIVYSNTKDLKLRNQADLDLANKAWQRVKARDASFGERANSLLVTNIMKTKAKFGMGLKKKNKNRKQETDKMRNKKHVKKLTNIKKKKSTQNNVLKHLISKTKSVIKTKKPATLQSAIKLAIDTAKQNLIGKKLNEPLTRVIPIPKTGGVLPFLVPLFAGLSALGALTGGVTGVAKAVNEAKHARNELAEKVRHNKQLEAIAVGKGFYLKPYRKGLGLYLNPKNY